MTRFGRIFMLTCFLCPAGVLAGDDEMGNHLIAAMLGKNQMIENLASLTDEIGGRPTGSDANMEAVEWAMARFKERGVHAYTQPFSMPKLWLEKSVTASVEGDVAFRVNAVAMPYSVATQHKGMQAPIVDAGNGRDEDFAALGSAAKGAFVLVHTQELNNLADLFREYGEAPNIDARANKAGAAGVVYMSSRPRNLLYRHNASLGVGNKVPMIVMERESASRVSRLLAQGKNLSLKVAITLNEGDTYTSYNVIGEIPGKEKKDEVVVIGAHLDSWDLGTGALDNGCNVAMLIEIAAQMKRLGIQPQRTIRFCLWNGEEQGLFGSWGYTVAEEKNLDNHVMALSMDIGSGKLLGFFMDGPKPFLAAVEKALEPVAGLGPFSHIPAPVVGTDNYDFMMQGIGNLVGNQASANYGPNYHAASDTFDKVDQAQLRLNSAIVATLTYQFGNLPVTWKRRTRAELEALVASTDLEKQMRGWRLWEPWLNKTRGRK